jgi:hypothetical protein
MDTALDIAQELKTDIISNFTPSPRTGFNVKVTDINPSGVVQFKIQQT